MSWRRWYQNTLQFNSLSETSRACRGEVPHFASAGCPLKEKTLDRRDNLRYEGGRDARCHQEGSSWQERDGLGRCGSPHCWGDTKIEPPPKSTPITKELEGSWEGALDVNGTTLRLVLKLASQADGLATGTLVSVDQGGAEVPIAAVVQNGAHLTLVVPAVAGKYDGDLSEGQLTGTWTQGPRTWPLVLKRAK